MRWLIFMALLFNFTYGKIFKKCDLAAELKFKHNFSMEDVKNWVCIAEYESTFNTESINPFNWDGSKDFGLFQLNNRYWCGNDHGSNVCNIPCEALLDDDLSDDIACAQRIVRDTKKWMKSENGLVAWVAYVKQCQYKNLEEYIQECAEELSVPPSTEATLPEATPEVPAEAPQGTEQQQMESSTSPPRASGFENPRRPPTQVSEESASDSESSPPRASGIGSASTQPPESMAEQNMKPEPSDMMPMEQPEKEPSSGSVEPMEEEINDQKPSRASGLGSGASPDISDADSGSNVISLANLPIRASALGETPVISQAKPDLMPVSEDEEDDEKEEEDKIVLSSPNIALQQAIQNLENLQQDLIKSTSVRQKFEAPQYEPPTLLNEFYAPDFTEYLPNEQVEVVDRYAYEPLSDSDISVMQFLQEHGGIPMFESRLPTYVNPEYQEVESPYSNLPNVYQTFREEDAGNIDPFSLAFDQSQNQFNPDFAPKKAFSFWSPFSGGNIRNIFKPLPIFSFNKGETVTTTTPASTDTDSSGFNFIKPLLVPQLDFKPININIRKLIKPIKIPIHYPKLNVIKETLSHPTFQDINLSDFIKPISKPEFKPFEIGLKKVVKPIPVPTLVKKPIEMPHIEFKPVNFSFLKPTFDKFNFWKDDQPKERTFYDGIY